MESKSSDTTSPTSPTESIPPPGGTKIYAFLYSLREMIANWKLPCSNKYVRHWMDSINAKINNPKSQRRIVLVIVCIALLLDNMLYMVIVPIIPTYLRSIHAFGENDPIYKMVNVTYNVTTSEVPTMSTISYSPGVITEVTPAGVQKEPNNTLFKSIRMMAGVYQNKNEDVNIGVLFACKAIFQLLVNPFTGTLMDRIGYDIPMMIGLTIIFFSTSMFAIGRSYGALFVARSMQGIGSAFADTSGLAMIADRYQEDGERSAALGIALAFISFGSLVAPPFGGSLYEFAGKAVPFIILALIALGDGLLMMFATKPVRKQRKELKKQDKLPNATPIYKLIIDPYIAVCAGCLVMANVSLAFIEPTIALWMRDKMSAPEWQIGLIWLPAFIPHVAGVFITVKLAERYPSKQWLMAAIGLALEGTSCMIIPFCTSFALLMLPLSILCFGIALVDTAILPLMAHMVDVRHVSVYGSVYAIADISYSLAYSFGPILAGQITKTIGFTALNAGIFVSNILYAPLLAFLRKVYDYHKFDPEDELMGTGDDGTTPNHKLYQTFTADGEDQDMNLDLTEQVINKPFQSNGNVSHISHTDEEEEEEEVSDSEDEVNEGTALTDKSKPTEHHPGNVKGPVPLPRRPSVDHVPAIEVATASEQETDSDESDY